MRKYKPLFIMALVTSPLLGIYNVTPISLLLSTDLVSANFPMPFSDSPFGFLLPAFFITLNALVVWSINIGLVSVYQKKAMAQKSNSRYLISYVVVLLFVFTFQQIVGTFRTTPPNFGNMQYFPFVGSFINNTIILIIIELMLTRNRKAQLELEKANLEVLNQKSRYDQLKQQIKPHFLFNALNTLKLLVKNKTENAEDFVVNLSNFLRSSLTDQNTEKLLVKKDLEIFNDFMKLQQVRFPKALVYECDIPEEILETKFLPAFTLQILAENATKHNGMSSQYPLKISIHYENGRITFSNNLYPRKGDSDSTGIGLKNLSERFQILAGSDINISEGNGNFSVSFAVIDS